MSTGKLRKIPLTIIDSRYMSEFEASEAFRQYAFAIPAEPVRNLFGSGETRLHA
mgnify:CR=1 FL=1